MPELGFLSNFPDLRPLLDDLRGRLRSLLSERLVGLYLFGSVATGDYVAGVSDVDLLVALRSDLDRDEARLLTSMHHELVVAHPAFDNRVEALYISVDALQSFRQRRSRIGVISPGEPLNVKEAGTDWLMNWFLVQEYGIRLLGPDPRQFIPNITVEEFVESIRDHAASWKDWIGSKKGAQDQSYAILTMCRALYTCTRRAHVSKERAAEWVASELPEWRPTIERALLHRTLPRADARLSHAKSTYEETTAFVELIAGRVFGRDSGEHPL